MATIEAVIQQWADIGVFDVVLPFVLSVTVVYALLQKTELFGKNKQKINIMLSIILGFLVVTISNITGIITSIAQYFALGAIILVLILLVLGFSGANIEKMQSQWFLWVIALLLFGTISLYALGWWKWIDINVINRFVLVPILGFIIFFFIIWFVTKESTSREEASTATEEPAAETPAQSATKKPSTPEQLQEFVEHAPVDDLRNFMRTMFRDR
jgi:preprotein translocase subunit YajC